MIGAEQKVRGLALPSDLKTVEITGTRLAYREQGSGEPVVFVHGGFNDLTIWDYQLPVVGVGYRAITYSLRYTWPNEDLPSGEKDTMGPHVEDLLAFLSAVDAYPAHLVGNSWGAFICLVAAIREPAAVRSLVLEEPPLMPLLLGSPPAPARILGSLLRHPLVTLAIMRFGAGRLLPVTNMAKAGDIEGSLIRFAGGFLGDEAFGSLPEEVRVHMLANASSHLRQFLAEGGFEPITESQIRSINAPALVVSGAESPLFLRRLADLLASLLPHSQRLVVPSASHLMHLQNPTALNAGLLLFLGNMATDPSGCG